MKSILLTLNSVVLLLVTNVQGNNSFLLPVEVLGQEGLVVSRTLNLPAASATSATELWLMVNNLSYQNKASIKINNGSWVSLNHNTVKLQYQEEARGGMAHGGFNTIRFSVPFSNFVVGDNTIEFRFDKSDGISMGYRIVRLNVIDNSGNMLLPSSAFAEVDPKTWSAPEGYTSQTAINEGKDLWNNADLWNHYLPDGRKGFWYGQELPASRPMKAKCSSCHAQDGRDLEMFSYSNESIIERAKFHKLSEVDGKKIAAYIRSLSSKPNVERHGRPWNPPYQPGPELKDKPIEQWAAGAGIDAVLDKDEDMLPYLFPNGTDKNDIRNAFDSEIMDDRTLLPLAIQFPDWKHWLPLIHPMDAYDKNNWFTNTLPDSKNPVKAYENVRSWFENSFDPSNFPRGNTIPGKFRDMWIGTDDQSGFRKFHEYNASGCSADHWRTDCGDANKNLSDGIPLEFANTSLARLLAVKNFELMNEFDLQDKAKLCVPNVLEDQPAERQWPSNTYSVFEIPPHFTAVDTRSYETQDVRTGHYENTLWYNVQMVINGGNGLAGGTTPQDFNYHNPFMLFASSTSGINEPLRYFSAINHMYQIRTWSKPTGPSNEGFRIRFMGPWLMMGSSDSNQEFFSPSYSIVKQLDDIEMGLSDKVLEALLLQFLEEAEKYDPNSWPRVSPHGKNYELDPISKKTSDLVSVPHTGNPTSGRLTEHFADKMYDIIPRIKNNFNVHCTIINRMADWSKSVWPDIDFEKFKESGCAEEECTSVNITSGVTYRIRTVHNKCLSSIDYNGGSVTQQACDYEDDKRWELEDAGVNYFYIKNIATGEYMQSPNNNNASALIEGEFSGADNQKWLINASEDCGFTISAKINNKCLDLKGGNKDNGSFIQQYDCEPVNNNRRFVFEPMTDRNNLSVSISKITDGEEGNSDVTLKVALDDNAINETGSPISGFINYSGTADADNDFTRVNSFSIANGQSEVVIALSVLDDEYVEDTESIIVTIFDLNNIQPGTVSVTAFITDNDNCQNFGDVNASIFTIKTKNDKCISSITGNEVTQQTCSVNSNEQKWFLEEASDNHYFIKNGATDLYLQTPDLLDGTPLVTSGFTGNTNQQWLLTQNNNCLYKISSRSSEKCIDLKRGLNADGTVLQQWECILDENAVNREFSIETTLITALNNEWRLADDIVLYPNPTSEALTIRLPQNTNSAYVELYNLNGQLVIEKHINNQDMKIDLSFLSKGMYHVKVTTSVNVVSQNLMID